MVLLHSERLRRRRRLQQRRRQQLVVLAVARAVETLRQGWGMVVVQGTVAVAMVTSTSMETTLTLRAWYAWMAMGAAPRTDAMTIAHAATFSAPRP